MYVGRFASAWCAASGHHYGQWLQVDLHSVISVAGVRTQGRGDYPQWVTRYKLSFSTTDGVVWDTYSEQGQEKEFTGNRDRNTIVTRLLLQPVLTRFVRFHPLSWSHWPSMRIDVLLCAPVVLPINIALRKPAFQSSVHYGHVAGRAVDGDTNTDFRAGSCQHTSNVPPNSTWWVDLGKSATISSVVIFNRQDCCPERLNPFNIHIGDSDQISTNPKCGGDHQIALTQPSISVPCQGMQGRYVGVRLPGDGRILTVCEVQVLSTSGCESCGYISLGCWSDTPDRAIPTLEGTDPLLDGSDYHSRTNALEKCFQVALSRGLTVFAVQDGGWCAGSADAHRTYNKYGRSTACAADGEGGTLANEVYQITVPTPVAGYTVRAGVCSGNDILSLFATGISRSQCADRCSSSLLCVAFNFSNGDCYPKHATCEQPDNSTAVFYDKDPCDRWTAWLSGDTPTGLADGEVLCSFLQRTPAQVCPGPTRIQARVRGTQQEAGMTGEVFAAYDAMAGFWCINADQTDNRCLDYEVRFCCPASGQRCPVLCHHPNGAVSGSNSYGDVVTFTCRPGYGLVGASSLFCRSSGTWSGPLPICGKHSELMSVENFMTFDFSDT
ncbi:uncharacterized protein LOC144926966 [Branchiostoma floridae x Branchiostoma belcheri]